MTPSAASLAAALASSMRLCGTSMRLGAVTGLARIAHHRDGALGDGLGEGAVVEHDVRALAAQFLRHPLDRGPAAFLAISTPARVDPVKLTIVDVGMARNRFAHARPVAIDKVEDACRNARRIHDFGEDIGVEKARSLKASAPSCCRVASAGKTLQAIWLSGQFHGVIMPTTPTGSHTWSVGRSSWRSNAKPSRISIAFWQCPVRSPTCGPFARLIGAPISSLTAVASSFLAVLDLGLDRAQQRQALFLARLAEGFERAARSGHGLVDIGLGAEADVADGLFGRRVLDRAACSARPDRPTRRRCRIWCTRAS